MALIQTNGPVDLNMVRAGPKGSSPVIFLHPVGLDLTWWGEQFDALSSDHDVVAFDLPNHGLSGKLEGPPTFELMADALEEVLQHVAAGPAHLVGDSVGGMIAQTFAVRRPSMVKSLCLVATLCTFPDEVRASLKERARVARTEGMTKIAELSNERWFPQAFRERRPDMLDRATKSLLQQDPDFHGSMWDMVSTLDLAAAIPSISCPTLVIGGGEDVNAPAAAVELIASLIPKASLTTMPDVGHFPPFESPRAFNELLRGFLASQPQTSGKEPS